MLTSASWARASKAVGSSERPEAFAVALAGVASAAAGNEQTLFKAARFELDELAGRLVQRSSRQVYTGLVHGRDGGMQAELSSFRP